MVEEYLRYHEESSRARDIDPANDALRYISDRFELNVEQRYWLSFLYASTYSPVSAYYIYNEFPDYENVDIDRLTNWWGKNKDKVIFQTDRLRVKSNDQFIPSFISYKELLGGLKQKTFFNSLIAPSTDITYDNVYKEGLNIYTFGRFTLFLYLEILNVLTGLPLEPTTLNLKEADSCRNGLVYALDLNHLDTHGTKKRLSKKDLDLLQHEFRGVIESIHSSEIEHKSIWNIETTLCAVKKYKLGKRYVGYYIERNRLELEKMERTITEGINWKPLWDFRKETYDKKWLNEL